MLALPVLQIADNVPDEVLREGLAVKTLLILKNLDAPVQVKMAKIIAVKGKHGKDIGAREVRKMVEAAEGKPEKEALRAAQQIADSATEIVTTPAIKKQQLKELKEFISETDAMGRKFAGRLEELLDPEMREAFNNSIYRTSESRQRLEATCRKIHRYFETLTQAPSKRTEQKLLTSGGKE